MIPFVQNDLLCQNVPSVEEFGVPESLFLKIPLNLTALNLVKLPVCRIRISGLSLDIAKVVRHFNNPTTDDDRPFSRTPSVTFLAMP